MNINTTLVYVAYLQAQVNGPMDQVQALAKLAMKIILPFPKRCVCRLASLHWKK